MINCFFIIWYEPLNIWSLSQTNPKKGYCNFAHFLVIWRSSFFQNDKKIPKSFQSFQMQLWRVRQFSECSKNHIELLKKIRKVSLCFLEYIEKFNAGGFSVKLECSEGKVSLEQGYALKKIIPVLHAMWVNMCFTSCPPFMQRYTNTNTNINTLQIQINMHWRKLFHPPCNVG